MNRIEQDNVFLSCPVVSCLILFILFEKLMPSTCWNCHRQFATDHFCPHCQAIQPSPPADHFAFFGLPRKLNLDAKSLEEAFHNLSRKFHPDFFVTKSEREKMLSLEKSSALNNAYRTLRNPIARVQYLWEIEIGQKFGEEVGEQQQMPMEFLEEILETRETMMEFQEALMEGDEERLPALKEGLRAAQDKLTADLAQVEEQLQSAFNEWDALTETNTARAVVLDKFKDLLSQRKYLAGLTKEIEKILRR